MLLEMMKNRKGRTRGFTLIELLVVVAIILILASLLIPAVKAAIEAGKKNTAINEMKEVEAAWKSYQQEYAVFPPNIDRMDAEAVRILSGTHTTYNTRKLPLMEFSSAELGGLEDPWGAQYYLAFDGQSGDTGPALDNKIDLSYGAGTDEVFRVIAVWSTGKKNGVYVPENDDDDDLKSWKY